MFEHLSMLDAALRYLPLKIFPCQWPVPREGAIWCSCGKPAGKGDGFCSSAGKHPRTPKGFYDASADEKVIREWWRRMPRANIGLPTGRANNLLVLDVDPPHGGDKTLVELERKYDVLPPTLRVNTGSGGEHIFFRHVDGLSNCVGAIGGGLDIRTEGGYVVAPPSLHPSGRRYEWANDLSIAEAPTWLIAEIKRHGGAAPEEGQKGGQYDYWSRIASGVKAGERHVMILKLAGILVGDRRLPATLALALLRSFNKAYCDPPLDQSEVDERFSRVVKRQAIRERTPA